MVEPGYSTKRNWKPAGTAALATLATSSTHSMDNVLQKLIFALLRAFLNITFRGIALPAGLGGRPNPATHVTLSQPTVLSIEILVSAIANLQPLLRQPETTDHVGVGAP